MPNHLANVQHTRFGLCILAWILLLGAVGVAQGGAATIPLDCNPAALAHPLDRICELARRQEGHRLFSKETFGGNGRTCETCHSEESGTFNPDDALVRFLQDPLDPLFLHDGLDDGVAGVSRILEHATVRVTLPLPDYVTLKDDPTATHVTFLRGTPTVKNVPAFDDRFMVDLRHTDLQSQALGAVHSHTQNSIEPTPLELELIAEFQQSSGRFFSNGKLRKLAEGGPPPELPEGTTESEQRGRLFFVDVPFQPPGKDGACALCHSGPNLDQANVFSSPVFGNPPGVKEFSIGVSERNFLGNPEYTFLIHDPLGDPVEVTTPDLGMLMTDWNTLLSLGAVVPDPVLAFLGIRRGFFANFFKTPTLWGVKDTAPYFHDNSAKDHDEMLEQYDWFFLNDLNINGQIELTEQDREDIKAFLNLL
jgi:cytochrome c peroxidase